KLLREAAVIRNAKPLEIVNLMVPGAAPRIFEVEGKIVSRVSAGVGGIRVKIVSKRVGDDIQLVETDTAEDGAYRITFPDTKLPQNGNFPPALQARVFVGDTFVADSDVRYNPTNHEILDVMLPDKPAAALPSEYDTLTATLGKRFPGKLRDLKESDDRKDITYLANTTGWDARAVALAALADKFSAGLTNNGAGVAIEPIFFYALFRAGLPANEDMIYHTDAGTLETAWKAAAEQGVIPQTRTREIPDLVKKFQALSMQKMLTGPALIGTSSLKEMLVVSGLDDGQQKQFAELYAAH